jgi:hypothetical protein
VRGGVGGSGKWQPASEKQKKQEKAGGGSWSFDGLLESLSAPVTATCTAPGTKAEPNWWQVAFFFSPIFCCLFFLADF